MEESLLFVKHLPSMSKRFLSPLLTLFFISRSKYLSVICRLQLLKKIFLTIFKRTIFIFSEMGCRLFWAEKQTCSDYVVQRYTRSRLLETLCFENIDFSRKKLLKSSSVNQFLKKSTILKSS